MSARKPQFTERNLAAEQHLQAMKLMLDAAQRAYERAQAACTQSAAAGVRPRRRRRLMPRAELYARCGLPPEGELIAADLQRYERDLLKALAKNHRAGES